MGVLSELPSNAGLALLFAFMFAVDARWLTLALWLNVLMGVLSELPRNAWLTVFAFMFAVDAWWLTLAL